MTSVDHCKDEDLVCKFHLHNCPLCSTEVGCMWGKDERCIKDRKFKIFFVYGTVIIISIFNRKPSGGAIN